MANMADVDVVFCDDVPIVLGRVFRIIQEWKRILNLAQQNRRRGLFMPTFISAFLEISYLCDARPIQRQLEELDWECAVIGVAVPGANEIGRMSIIFRKIDIVRIFSVMSGG